MLARNSAGLCGLNGCPGLGGTGSVSGACPAGKKAIAATAGYNSQLRTLDVVCATVGP